jgi:hypothetical protein
MLDILEWALDVLGFTYTRLDGRYFFVHSASLSKSGCFFYNFIVRVSEDMLELNNLVAFCLCQYSSK